MLRRDGEVVTFRCRIAETQVARERRTMGMQIWSRPLKEVGRNERCYVLPANGKVSPARPKSFPTLIPVAARRAPGRGRVGRPAPQCCRAEYALILCSRGC